MGKRFTASLEAEDRANLKHMADVSGTFEADVVRQLINLASAFLEKLEATHPVEPGETLGLAWIGEAYDPKIIEEKDGFFMAEFWREKQAEMDEWDSKRVENLQQLEEIESRELRIESESTRCERCEYKDYYDRGIAEQTRRAEEYEMYKFSHRLNFSLQWPWNARKTALFVFAMVIIMLAGLGLDLSIKWLQFHNMLSGFGL